MTRAVVDSNLVVNRAISTTGAAAEILQRWRQDRFELAVSPPILEEYRRALGYERVRARHGMGDDEIDELVDRFRRFAIVVEPTEHPKVVAEDPDDDKFVACAVAAGAGFVVTRDKHLLKLRDYQGIRILSPAAFLAFLDAEDRDAEDRPGARESDEAAT